MPGIEKGLSKSHDVIGRRKKTRVPSDAPHGKGIGIVNLAPENSLSPGTVFGGGDSPANCFGHSQRLVARLGERQESRLLHAQGFKNSFGAKQLQGLA